MSSGRSILVTGATGFLGKALVPRLAAAGHRVRMMSRSSPGPELLEQGEFVQADVAERAAVKRALAGVDVLYHLAGMVSFDPADGPAMYRLHVAGTRGLLEEVRARGGLQRLVLASTSGTTAVSRTERTATEEDLPPVEVVGRWPYYLSKIYEEKLVLEFAGKHSLPVVVLNPSLLLGPGDERLSSTWTVMKFLQRDLPVMPNGGISFVDVRDAAEAFVAALDRGELGGKHLMGVNMSMSEFFGRLERISGVPAPRLRLPSKVNVAGAKLLEKLAEARGREPVLDAASVDIAEHWFWVDSRKAERELGFSPRDPQETLQDTVLDLLSRMPEKQWPGTKGKLAALRRS
ncbi:MAG TPA: NAD-dependent epimerase/dehydratase family protein [Myxococcaceae bacterium]|nr:NAD-dependent epimerase/dehydratase family protein [Myxococcaceae bacterium]